MQVHSNTRPTERAPSDMLISPDTVISPELFERESDDATGEFQKQPLPYREIPIGDPVIMRYVYNRGPRVGQGIRSTFVAIGQHAEKNTWIAEVSHEDLKHATDVGSPATLKRHTRILEDLGYVTIIRRPGGGGNPTEKNRYHITHPADGSYESKNEFQPSQLMAAYRLVGSKDREQLSNLARDMQEKADEAIHAAIRERKRANLLEAQLEAILRGEEPPESIEELRTDEILEELGLGSGSDSPIQKRVTENGTKSAPVPPELEGAKWQPAEPGDPRPNTGPPTDPEKHKRITSALLGDWKYFAKGFDRRGLNAAINHFWNQEDELWRQVRNLELERQREKELQEEEQQDELAEVHHVDVISPDQRPETEPERIWEEAKAKLSDEVPRPTYETWIKNTKGMTLEAGVLTIAARSAHQAEWLEKRIFLTMSRAAEKAAGQKTELKIAVWEEQDVHDCGNPGDDQPGDAEPGDAEPGNAGDAGDSGPQIGAESDILRGPELPSHQEAADTGAQVPPQGEKANEAGTEPDGSFPDQGGGRQAPPGSPGLAHGVDQVEDGTRDTAQGGE